MKSGETDGRILAEALTEAQPERQCAMCGYDPDAPVGARWEFVLPLETLSLNAQHRGGDAKWQHVRYKKERNAWQWAVKVARVNHKITPATGKRRVTLTRLYGKGCRAYDEDNLRGGLKPCIDSMVREGILQQDDRKHAEVHYRQERAADGVSALRVTVEELI